VLNENLTNAKLETLTERLKLAAMDNMKAANDLILVIDKSNGQLKKALCKPKKKK
jgi:hypothetical protein